MARLPTEPAARVFEVVERWVEVGLRRDVIYEFHQLHVQAPRPAGGTFESNLLDQLAGASEACRQSAAELVSGHFLSASDRAIGWSKKLDLVDPSHAA